MFASTEQTQLSYCFSEKCHTVATWKLKYFTMQIHCTCKFDNNATLPLPPQDKLYDLFFFFSAVELFSQLFNPCSHLYHLQSNLVNRTPIECICFLFVFVVGHLAQYQWITLLDVSYARIFNSPRRKITPSC